MEKIMDGEVGHGSRALVRLIEQRLAPPASSHLHNAGSEPRRAQVFT
jgi:hypothetical protein